jgi:hypothetical protein
LAAALLVCKIGGLGMGMSMRSYARSRNADERAVRRAVADGIIHLVDGRVDPEQADAAWASTRRASRMGARQLDDAGVRSARSKIAVKIAQFRMLRDRYEAARERYIDRAEFIEVAAAESRYVLDALRAAPATYATAFALELAIEPGVAKDILTEFMTLALAEVGDLVAQAVADAKRA